MRHDVSFLDPNGKRYASVVKCKRALGLEADGGGATSAAEGTGYVPPAPPARSGGGGRGGGRGGSPKAERGRGGGEGQGGWAGVGADAVRLAVLSAPPGSKIEPEKDCWLLARLLREQSHWLNVLGQDKGDMVGGVGGEAGMRGEMTAEVGIQDQGDGDEVDAMDVGGEDEGRMDIEGEGHDVARQEDRPDEASAVNGGGAAVPVATSVGAPPTEPMVVADAAVKVEADSAAAILATAGAKVGLGASHGNATPAEAAREERAGVTGGLVGAGEAVGAAGGLTDAGAVTASEGKSPTDMHAPPAVPPALPPPPSLPSARSASAPASMESLDSVVGGSSSSTGETLSSSNGAGPRTTAAVVVVPSGYHEYEAALARHLLGAVLAALRRHDPYKLFAVPVGAEVVG